MKSEEPKKIRMQQQPPEEEVAHLDDRVVGKAFIWSAIAFVAIAALVIGGLIYARRKPPKVAPNVTPLSAPASATINPVSIPKVKFTDITAAAGINFTHFNSASPEKLLPETMGAGAAFFDFDNDGDQDLLFVNGTRWPWERVAGALPNAGALRQRRKRKVHGRHCWQRS